MDSRIMDREVLREDYFESKGKYPSNKWLDSAMKMIDDMYKGYASVDGDDSGKNNEFNKGQDKLSFITGMGFRYYHGQDTDNKAGC